MQTFLGPFIDGQWVKGAYDTVIDLGQTEWRDLARPRYRPSPDDRPLRHLAIYFDEGPCFECVCETFRVARRYGDEEPADDANPYDVPRIEEA